MRVLVAGGAGFIGSSLVQKLLARSGTQRVVVFDNFTSGKEEHLAGLECERLGIVRGDIKDLPALDVAMRGIDLVYHLASNPDIAKAVTQPDIDFWEGTFLTQNVLEAMRRNGVRRIVYASGSGVYGDRGMHPCGEDEALPVPISTYGASKLAGEALISAYSHMFEISGAVFRFANVVGPRQTHGVAHDFVRRLKEDPASLRILGDGTQSKSYIHVEDILDAIDLVLDRCEGRLVCHNLATEDYISVRQIADCVVERMGLSGVRYEFTGGDRGWKGDVPVVRFDLGRIHALGWRAKRTSLEAIGEAVDSMLHPRTRGPESSG